ncbi:MAG: hypothetical protein IPN60_15740 [Saprospiraceae bacterium]|nr:hypothetical protein [Candidatus Opimibacter skivensis]
MKPNLKYLLLFALSFVLEFSFAQVVFNDDFSDNSDPNWTATGNLSGSAWDVYRLGVDFGARRNDTPAQLELSNDISGCKCHGYAFAATSSAFSQLLIIPHYQMGV